MTCQIFLEGETDRSQAQSIGDLSCLLPYCTCSRRAGAEEGRKDWGAQWGTPVCRCDTTTYIRLGVHSGWREDGEGVCEGEGARRPAGAPQSILYPLGPILERASLLLIPRSLPLSSSPASGEDEVCMCLDMYVLPVRRGSSGQKRKGLG